MILAPDTEAHQSLGMRGDSKNSDNSLPWSIMPVNTKSPRCMVFNIRLKDFFAIVSRNAIVRVCMQSLMLYVGFHKRKGFSYLVNFFVMLRGKLPDRFSRSIRQI